MELLAHLRPDTVNGYVVQTLAAHCQGTSETAREVLLPAHLAQSGAYCGLIHDMGKATEKFNRYIRGIEAFRKGDVNHTFAAVRAALDGHREPEMQTLDDAAEEILAFAVGAHHGFFDLVDERHQNGFTHRLTKPVDYDEAVRNFTKDCVGASELAQRKAEAVSEVAKKLAHLTDFAQTEEDVLFYAGLLARLLASAVMEGDRRDTAEFMNGLVFEKRTADWSVLRQRVEERLAAFPSDAPLAAVRRQISDTAAEAAGKPCGLFRLNVPTGGGKTLTGLRFALAHAEKHSLRRVIFLSPLLSILEQNAAVIRDFLADDTLITEHHANMVLDEQTPTPEEKREREFLTDSWSSPVIITTLVQFLNTLFSQKTSCVRRMQALCGSVIVLDEVQTVPIKMLTLFNRAVEFLTEICGASVVLCSATQPCFEKTERPLVLPVVELVPRTKALLPPRTMLIPAGKRRMAEMPDFALEKLQEADSELIICNTKREAAEIYTALSKQTKTAIQLFHLSAGMCPAHRRTVLADIQKALAAVKGRTDAPKVAVVSTQVVEAGVDISFACVIRFAAGLDSLIQAAGRCNRNAENAERAPVYVVDVCDENLSLLQEIDKGKAAYLSLLSLYERNAARFSNDLMSDEAVRFYYEKLYANAKGKAFDYPIALADKTSCTLYELLSDNRTFLPDRADEYSLHQAFYTAGSLFEVFDQSTTDVLVPYGDGRKLLCALDSSRAANDLAYTKNLLRQCADYSVSLYAGMRKTLEKAGALTTAADGKVLVLRPAFYDAICGVVQEPKPLDAMIL